LLRASIHADSVDFRTAMRASNRQRAQKDDSDELDPR
jgi:hypothetical protein